MMKSIKNQQNRKTQPTFFNDEEGKKLPVAFNVSSTSYVSLRVKKRFIDRYLMSKQISQNCRSSHQETKHKPMIQTPRRNNQNPIEVSPIKIHDNSPQLIRQRIKAEYPKLRYYRCQRKDNIKSVYKAINVQFLQNKPLHQPKSSKFKISKLSPSKKQSQLAEINRPMTANDVAYNKQEKTRRTKTIEIGDLIRSSKGIGETNYAIKGWDNETPQYDN